MQASTGDVINLKRVRSATSAKASPSRLTPTVRGSADQIRTRARRAGKDRAGNLPGSTFVSTAETHHEVAGRQAFDRGRRPQDPAVSSKRRSGTAMKEISGLRNMTLSELVGEIDSQPPAGQFSSAIRSVRAGLFRTRAIAGDRRTGRAAASLVPGNQS